MRILEYIDDAGRSPFARWFEDQDAHAAAKVTRALSQMERGNLSNAKGVGRGLFEYRLDFGPGYRIYFGRDGDELIILLAGGTKRRQQQDILAAAARWQDYRKRKRN
jgi:putative addiction module killer protein